VSVEAVAWARESLGPDIALMVDCNGHFNVTEAIAFSRAIAAHDVYWLEEPVRPMRDIESLARVARAGPLPIAAGENEYSPADFQRLLASGSIGWLQPEITKIGGLTAARRISALAELHNVVLAPHNFRIGPCLYASIHWGLSSPATGWLEMPWLPEGRAFPSGAQLPPLRDGQVELPEGPGFGLNV
jgi:galactonate dehydratase